MPRPPATKTALLSAALGALVGAFLVGGPARRAEAKPAYAAKEGKECAYCHVNSKGGGPRNPKGAEYEKNGHKFSTGPAGYGEDLAFSTEANGAAYAGVLRAMDLAHWSAALSRLKALASREKPKGAAAQKILNTYAAIDGKGRDLSKAARDAVAGGRTREAAEALARVEAEFKGREPSKEASRLRTDLQRLPGGKEADVAAKALETQRLQFLDAGLKAADGDRAGALKAFQDFVAKYPDGPFSAEAKARVGDLSKAATAAGPAAPSGG